MLDSCDLVGELLLELCGNGVADRVNLSIELGYAALEVLKPILVLNGKDILEIFDGELVTFADIVIKTLEVDVLSVGNITDSGLFCINGAFASLDDPLENAEVVAEAGPHEVAIIIKSEPVNVEDLGKIGSLGLHVEPMCKVVAHVVATEGKHSHRVSSYDTDCTGSCSGSLGSHDGTNKGTVLPVEGLIYERSGLSTASAEDDSRERNSCRIVELAGNAGAVLCRSGETGVRVSTLAAVGAIPLLTDPVDSFLRRILVESFPPNSVVSSVVNNVGEDGALLGRDESVGVGLHVGTGSNTEETVLGVCCPESAVVADADPSDIVAHAPYLVALAGVNLRRDKHCEVGLTASGGECGANIFCFAVRIFNAENEHMLCHPTLFASEVGCDTECEALLSEKHVSAVARVDRPDCVVLGEVADVSVFLGKLCSCVESLDKVGAVAEVIEHVETYACHNEHIEYNVDGVCKLDSVFCKG